MKLYSGLLNFQSSRLYTVLFESHKFVIKRLKRNIRTFGELLKERAFPVLSVPLPGEPSLKLLLFLTSPVSVIEFTIPFSA